jgi:hypothetical protein
MQPDPDTNLPGLTAPPAFNASADQALTTHARSPVCSERFRELDRLRFRGVRQGMSNYDMSCRALPVGDVAPPPRYSRCSSHLRLVSCSIVHQRCPASVYVLYGPPSCPVVRPSSGARSPVHTASVKRLRKGVTGLGEEHATQSHADVYLAASSQLHDVGTVSCSCSLTPPSHS